jgi:hypothetical protein
MPAKKKAAGVQRDWLALPPGVLVHIFCAASTWQIPGTCLVASVCRTWRAAAAGCRGIRLLYQAGRLAVDEALCTWLGHNSQQLEAFTLGSYYSSSKRAHLVLQALADAAAAAQAAGRPLQLRTLRVLGPGPDLATTGKLLANLPHLHTLQLAPEVTAGEVASPDADLLVQEGLAPLQQATQLRQLYLARPAAAVPQGYSAGIAELLPTGLQRLSWEAPLAGPLPDLSHATQLTFLQLRGGWERGEGSSDSTSGGLPPTLQQVELVYTSALPEVVKDRPGLVTQWHATNRADLQRHLSRLTSLQSTSVSAGYLEAAAVRTALGKHATLSALSVHASHSAPQPVIAALGTLASIRNLRCLELSLNGFSMPEASALSALTGVTRLSTLLASGLTGEHYRPLIAGIGGMTSLRWLSTSAVVLQAGGASLGALQQLRVLGLSGWATMDSINISILQWLQRWSQRGVPPQLQVLGLRGMTAEQATAWRLRPRMQGWLGSSRCEVVVGLDLDEVCDPTQQLAGLPVTLQQALA